MKKNTALILAGVVAGLLIVYCLFVMDMGGGETEFALEDASAVSSFTLTKMAKGVMQGEVHVWKAEDGQWKVMPAWAGDNGARVEGATFSGNEARINEFLKTASVVAVKDKIADRAQQDALEVLKQNHTVVSFYAQKKLLKRYLIGATNNSQTGNLMMLEGARNAFVVSRPGVDGYVSVQYSTELDGWREKLLMNVKGEELKLVSVTFADSLSPFSWTLSRESAEGIWKMPNVAMPDGQAILAYQRHFTGKVFAEGYATESYPEMTDSLKKRTPDIRFYCETLDGKSTGLVLYARPENPNNFFGWVEGQGELLTVQRFVFDKYIVPVDYFRPRQQ